MFVARLRTREADVARLVRMFIEKGPQRRALAFRKALSRGWIGIDYVDRIVKQKVRMV